MGHPRVELVPFPRPLELEFFRSLPASLRDPTIGNAKIAAMFQASLWDAVPLLGKLPGVGNAGLFSDVSTGQLPTSSVPSILFRLVFAGASGPEGRQSLYALRGPFDKLRAGCGLQSFAALHPVQGKLSRLVHRRTEKAHGIPF
jgi:hypothetical protein